MSATNFDSEVTILGSFESPELFSPEGSLEGQEICNISHFVN